MALRNCKEWSIEFDIMWNNIMSNQAPGLTEHEKSVFLSRAQKALALDFFSGKSDPVDGAFDQSAKRQNDFASLIVTDELSENSTNNPPRMYRGNSSYSKFFTYPEMIAVLNEELEASKTVTENGDSVTKYKYYQIVPVSQDEFRRLMSKPYKLPVKGQAWRLYTGTSSASELCEIVADYLAEWTIKYVVRYVKAPDPIILPDTQGGTETGNATATLSVDGSTSVKACQLPAHLHDEIMYRAVQLAKIAWSDGAVLGNNSSV